MIRDFRGLLKQVFKIVYFSVRFLLLKAIEMLLKNKTPYKIQDFENGRILVYGLKRLGDMVISIPAFEFLREKFPKAYIVLACTSYNKGLIEGIYFDKIITQPSGFFERMRFISEIKSYGFDMAIDLTCDYDIFPAFAIYKSEAKIRIGYNAEGRGIFFTKTLPFVLNGKHAIRLLMDIVNTICETTGDFSNIVPRYEPLTEDIEYVEDYLKKNNIKKTMIGIHPGAHFPSQRWAKERFAAAIDEIGRQGLGDPVIFGSSRDEFLIKDILMLVKSIKPFVVLNEPVKKFAAFIKSCGVFLCNNSGPLHLAAAMSVPTVSTMGPTDYDLWRPLGNKNIVIRKTLECSPCNLADCKEHKCMEMITVDEVIEAVKKQLKEYAHGC
ncbi:MAG: glycosyltransferase family 9 protein [Deltaproteobacteria bacterium]|nr:glycosyltransferase family 9 protein [Deltaproteobacteria bacterium]